MTILTVLSAVLAATNLSVADGETSAEARLYQLPASEISTEMSRCTTMSTAVMNALDFDPRIDGARANRDAARADVLSAHSRNLPEVSLFAQSGFGDTPPLDRRRDDQAGIRFDQELFSFGARRFANEAARHSYRASTHALDQSEGDIALGAALAYLEYARAQAAAELATEQAKTFEQDAEAAASRLSRRVITLTDASQIRARYARSRSDLVNANVAVEIAQTRLSVLTDDPVSCIDLSSITDFVAPQAPRVLGMAPEAALDEAMANSARLRRARSDVAAASARVSESSRANLPVVTLNGFAQSFSEQISIAPGVTDTDYDQDSRLGINITQDLYAGGRNKARKMNAMAELRRARADAELQRISVDDQIRASLATAKARREAGIDLLEARDQAKVQLDFTKREYDRGTKTLTDLVLATETFYLAATQEVEARYGFYISLLQLYSAMGLLSEDGLR